MEQAVDPDRYLEGFAAILGNEGRIRHVLTIVGEDSDEVNAEALTPDGEYLYLAGAVRLGADFSWLDVPVLDRKGRIRNDGSIVHAPGMYDLGLTLPPPPQVQLHPRRGGRRAGPRCAFGGAPQRPLNGSSSTSDRVSPPVSRRTGS